MTFKTTELEKAIHSLENALNQPKNEFTRDASIQRFEYTFELTWKVAKKALEETGIISLSPRSVIRDLGQQVWIQDIELWMHFLDSRNQTSHAYNEKIADQVYEVAKQFILEVKPLLSVLNQLKKQP
jgi:nucleotidyltransferase substrate binding protein (TIGR01987 family)